MIRSRTISITVKKETGDAFDAILQIPSKMIPDGKFYDDRWWTFAGQHGSSKLKFNECKSFGISDHRHIDEESVAWDAPMHVVSSGDYSEVIITLNKPEELSDEQFDQIMEDIGQMANSIKKIIESSPDFSQG